MLNCIFGYQGTVFGPLPFEAETLLATSNGDVGEQIAGNRETGLIERGISALPSKIFAAVNRIFHPNDVSSQFFPFRIGLQISLLAFFDMKGTKPLD